MMKPNYQNIVVLTGAGISAESGIQTFRASDGLWEEHKVEDVATPGGFARNPKLVQKFYNQRREQLMSSSVQENAAHVALAQLQKKFNGTVTIVTQNIDDLHERAGSKNVLHMHGELLKVRCSNTEQIFEFREPVLVESECECCGQTGTLRPHVVWFEEMPLYLNEIYRAVEQCDLFVAIGTSGNVYPAAGLVQIANQIGANTLEINLESSNVANQFKEVLYGKAGEIVPEWVKNLMI